MSQSLSEFKLLRGGCSRRRRKTNMDRLSELPDELIEKILMGIPSVDAVKTCVLSKKWQYKWTMLPNLLLDSLVLKAKSSKDSTCDFVCWLNDLLIHYRNRRLEDFFLVVPDLCYSKREYVSLVIRTVLRLGVKKLTVCNWCKEPITWSSCFPRSPSFTSLELMHFELKKQPFSRGFPNLSSLKFNDVECDPNTLSRCISESPNLQRIVLQNLNFEDHLLSICAPKLEYLYVTGKFKSIYLTETKKLKEMDINLRYMKEYSVWNMEYVIDFFGNLIQLESLRMHAIIYKVCGALISFFFFDNKTNIYWQHVSVQLFQRASYLTGLTRGLGQLRFFKLIDVDFWDAIMLRCFMCIILSSPCLSMLEIVACSVTLPGKDEGIELDVYKHHSLQHLTKVYIGPISGTKNELSVIKILLYCSPALQEIVISTKRSPEGEVIYKALATSHCASPDVVITVYHHDRANYFPTISELSFPSGCLEEPMDDFGLWHLFELPL